MTRPGELERFWSHVVKGPDPDDCWIWTGAISDDGYGRFWIRRGSRQQAVCPQRYAFTALTGRTLTPETLLLRRCVESANFGVRSVVAERCRDVASVNALEEGGWHAAVLEAGDEHRTYLSAACRH